MPAAAATAKCSSAAAAALAAAAAAARKAALEGAIQTILERRDELERRAGELTQWLTSTTGKFGAACEAIEAAFHKTEHFTRVADSVEVFVDFARVNVLEFCDELGEERRVLLGEGVAGRLAALSPPVALRLARHLALERLHRGLGLLHVITREC